MNRQNLLWVAIVVGGLVSFGVPASAGLVGMLQVGSIEGDSNVAGHENWSDILSYNISVQGAGLPAPPGAWQPTFSDMYVTKITDRGSPYYFGSLLIGTIFPTVRIDVVESTQPLNDYVQWILEEAVVSSYNTAFDAGQSYELLAIDFTRLTYTHSSRGMLSGFTYDQETGDFNWVFGEAESFALLTQFSSSPTPEPAALLLAMIGLAALTIKRAIRCRTCQKFRSKAAACGG